MELASRAYVLGRPERLMEQKVIRTDNRAKNTGRTVDFHLDWTCHLNWGEGVQVTVLYLCVLQFLPFPDTSNRYILRFIQPRMALALLRKDSAGVAGLGT